MDYQADKISLIQWLASLNDLQVIEELKAMRSRTANTLNPEEKAKIDQGLSSIEAGRIKTHEQVQQSTKEKYPQLFK